MTKFKEYILINEGRGKSIDEEELKYIAEKNCSDIIKYYKTGAPSIWRGTESIFNYQYMDTSKFEERSSRNTSNWYTLIINNTWGKEWPKRNLICTTDRNRALVYSNKSKYEAFLIFPFNGNKIGICSEYDLWNSFKYVESQLDIITMNEFNQDLKDMTYEKGIYLSDDNWNNFKKNMKEFDKKYDRSQLLSKYLYGKWNKYLMKNYKGDMMKILIDLLEPKKNGFKLTTIGNRLPVNKEVWIDGKVLLVAESKIGVIL